MFVVRLWFFSLFVYALLVTTVTNHYHRRPSNKYIVHSEVERRNKERTFLFHSHPFLSIDKSKWNDFVLLCFRFQTVPISEFYLLFCSAACFSFLFHFRDYELIPFETLATIESSKTVNSNQKTKLNEIKCVVLIPVTI